MPRRLAPALLATATSLLLAAPGIAAASGPAGPLGFQASSYALSPPAREIGGAHAPPSTGPAPSRVNPLPGRAGVQAPDRQAGARREPVSAAAPRGASPAPGLVFDGLANPFACGGCLPPDTVGDVGPNHYVQMVNATKVAIFNKNGTPAAAPFDLGDLWSVGQPCNDNDGDPQVRYDALADRWLLSQFHASPNAICFAISQTADPTGAYHLYTFPTTDFPDYFKVGVWPSGYYVGDNETTGYSAYAFDRTKMLAGDPSAGVVVFPGQETNFLMPANVEAPPAPDPQGGLFYTFKDDSFHGGADRLELFQLTPNFSNPVASSFTTVATLPVDPFLYTPCGFFELDCVRQPNTSRGLDAVGEWPMQPFPYRRFGDHESLAGTFTIGGAASESGAAPRWFELRNSGGGWGLFQGGTQDLADNDDRFMSSIAIAKDGSLALGYSASSSALFPSIRYATKDAGDPSGPLEEEQTLRAGGGSQTHPANRWGDYSAMNIDPDGCTFWYTNEYYASTSSSGWKTAIGNFRDPACPDADGDDVTDGEDECPAAAGGPPDGCPSNEFQIGRKTRNKKKGTATIAVTVPGPGELTLSGKKVRPQRAAAAAPGGHPKPVAGAGKTRLKVKPKGKLKNRLRKRGWAKARPSITYTPTAGKPNTKTTSVRLRLKHRRR